MSNERKRLTVVAGTTLALVLSGASIAVAQTDPSVTAPGPGATAPDGGLTAHGGSSRRGPDWRGGRGLEGRGDRGSHGDMSGRVRGALSERFDSLVSQTTVRLDADGNVLTDKVEHGTVSAVADGSITIDLATGESATVATDANTSAFSWSADDRPSRTEVAIAGIAAGADVVVWSQGQDDGSFLARRVLVIPAAIDASTEGAAPEASPAAVG